MKQTHPLLVSLLRNISATRTKPAPLDLTLFNSLRNSEQYESAILLLQNHILAFPNNAESYAHLAHIFMLQNVEESALSALKKAIELAPDNLIVLQTHSRWLHKKNLHKQALSLINQALILDENNVDTHELKTQILLANDDYQAALQQINTALELQKNRHSALAIRCAIHLRLKEENAAINDGITIVQAHPQRVDIWIMIMSAYQQLNLNQQAISTLQQGLEANPNHPLLINLLGELLIKSDRNQEAIIVLKRATSLTPNLPETWINFGAALQNVSDYVAAKDAYKKALTLCKEHPQIWVNLGVIAFAQNAFEMATDHFNRALEFLPNNLELLMYKGLALVGLSGKNQEIENILQRLVTDAPDQYMGYFLKAAHLQKKGHFKYAEIAIKQAFSIAPKNNYVVKFYSTLLTDLGRLDEAESMLELALKINPNDIDLFSILIFLKTYNARHSPQEILEKAKEFRLKIGEQSFHHQSHSDLNLATIDTSKLKIGLVSGDFRNHPVGYFISSVIQELAGDSIELHAYSNNSISDNLTAQLKPYFKTWTEITEKKDSEVKTIIEVEGIHILIDLSGHTKFNRLPLFAKKPAPLQATWAGFLATTGIEEIDWIIGDHFVTPIGDESHFSEGIWRMPESYACFTPPENAVEVNKLPALNSGAITFGSFNNLTKITDEVVRLWSQLLLSVPNSRLFLKYAQLDFSETVRSTQARFAQYGISSNRLILEGASPRPELLASYQRVDIALDPFPYGGGTTNFEALYMGVPILNISGDRFISRVGTCVMHFVGHPEFNAKDEHDFIQKGIELTRNISKLAETRQYLRTKALNSSLFDAKRFASQFKQALVDMWQHHINKLGNSS